MKEIQDIVLRLEDLVQLEDELHDAKMAMWVQSLRHRLSLLEASMKLQQEQEGYYAKFNPYL